MDGVMAVLSDIHANLEALEAVLRDVDRQGPDRIAVLGDTIGYGPDPRACLERALEIADVLLVGNHEKELVDASDDLNDDARESLDWTAKELQGVFEPVAERIRDNGIAAEALKVVESRVYVHGAPADPVEQYIWPAHHCQYLVFNDQIDERLAEFLAQFSESHGFFGHTHAPAVLTSYENHAIFDPYKGGGLE
jgi:predicted phosphodiesterase